jgi:hypothetical protein
MQQRNLLIAVILVTFLSVTLHAEKPSQGNAEQSCRTFVEGFYDWYVPLALHSVKAYETVLKGKTGFFSPSLVHQLREDYESQAHATEITGLDFDPFLNSQDPSDRFLVTSVRAQGKHCSTEVRGIASGTKQEEIHPELLLAGEKWQFVNFRYTKDSDLLGILRSLREEQRKADAEKR